MSDQTVSPAFPSLLQGFFCQRLINQRNVSSRTVQSYRDTFRLFLRYAEQRTRKPPVALTRLWRIWTRHSSSAFSTTCRKNAETALGLEISASSLCGPFFTMHLTSIRLRSRRSSASSRFR